MAVMSIISESIFSEGGAPKFLAERMNHQIVIAGKIFIIPFSRIRFRLWVVSYTVFAIANKPDEARPWAITNKSAPVHPHKVCDRMPAVISPMWLTEEYAISAFRSVCRKHKRLAIQAPHSLTDRIAGLRDCIISGKLAVSRKRP